MTTSPTDMVFKTEPLHHQLAELQRSRDELVWALLWEQGCGKTKPTIDTAAYLFNRGAINGLLVVSLSSVAAKWAKDEIPKHLPDHVQRRVVLWGGSASKLEKQLQELTMVEPMKLHVLCMNIESLRTERGFKAAQRFLMGHAAMMVVDESTIIKNPKATQTRCCTKLGQLAKYRRILNGTPITQSPLDAFAQFEFLQHGALGCTTYYGFRNQYAVLKKRYLNGRSFDEVVSYQRLNDLQSRMAAMSSRVLKKDCLDLPDKVYDTRYVELTPVQRRYYDQLRDEALAELGDGTAVAAPLAITCLLRLRQALCNLAPTPEGGTRPVDATDPRLSELMSIIEQTGEEQKVVIWGTFTESLRVIGTKLKEEYGADACAVIYGAVDKETRHEAVTKFQDPASSLRFIVANPATLGVGVDLYASSLVIYYNNDWSLYQRLQSEDRTHRVGQTQKVTYIDLVAPDTVDLKIRNALLEKGKLAGMVTGDTRGMDAEMPALTAETLKNLLISG